jgi:signal recognition particle subunit SEC65
MPLIAKRQTVKPKRATTREKHRGICRVISNKSRPADISRMIYAFNEKDGEAEQFQDAHKRFVYLKNKTNRAIKLTEALFNFGFTIDGRFFYIKSEGIISRDWTNDFDSIMDEARIIPRIYIIINNLTAEIEQVHREVRITFDVWCGKQWSKSDKVGDGLYGATNKRIEAYINRQPQGVDYATQMAELKNIHVKLKGVLKAVEMQHAAVVAAIYHTRRSGDIYNSGAGGIVNSLLEGSNMSKSIDDIRDSKMFDIDDPVLIADVDVEEEADRVFMQRKTGKAQ